MKFLHSCSDHRKYHPQVDVYYHASREAKAEKKEVEIDRTVPFGEVLKQVRLFTSKPPVLCSPKNIIASLIRRDATLSPTDPECLGY